MYYRLYPCKNNTIFKYTQSDGVSDVAWSTSINTGQSSIMEMQDGAGQSRLLFGFDIPAWLSSKLTDYSFTANLKLFDAGALYNSLAALKNVTLNLFYNDFSEGDGWSFLQPTAISETSNWGFSQDGIAWDFTTFQKITDYFPNSFHEDFVFDVSAAFAQAVSLNDSPNFSLNITDHAYAANVQAKFIYSKYTRTVFQPYVEFFINDEIIDGCFNMTAGLSNKIFFVNENGMDFSGVITATAILNSNTIVNLSSTKVSTGVYYVEVIPAEPMYSNKKEYVILTWQIGGVDYYKQTIQVQPQNKLSTGPNLANLFFYPATPYSHNIVRQGDIMPFEVVSQIRGSGNIVDTDYQFKVVTMDGFEMIPWMPVSTYREKMYFFIDTSFFFPEQTYEVITRNVKPNFTISSNLTYKFQLVQDAQSQLRELNASPYYARDSFFSK